MLIKTFYIKVRKTLQTNVKEAIEDIAQDYYNYMSTDEGKYRILNPPCVTPIMKVVWRPFVFSEVIQRRVDLDLQAFLQSQATTQRLKAAAEEIVSFYNRASADLSKMEKNWTVDHICEMRFIWYTSAWNSMHARMGTLIGSCFLPVFGLTAVFLATTFSAGIALIPLTIPVIVFTGMTAGKQLIIDREYNNCKESIKIKITNALESQCGFILNKMLDKVTVDVLPKRIQALKHMVEHLLTYREEILKNQESLGNVSKKIKAINDSVQELERGFQQPQGLS